MGWVIVLLLFAVIGGVVIAFALLGSALREGDRAKKNAPALLDATFAGDPVVTYTVTLASLDQETVIKGAAERGYRMTGSTQQGQSGPTTLVFERA